VRRRGGFTLIELLVVIVIIGILAGISYGAMALVQRTARVKRTQATIAKLHRIIMKKYQAYRERPVRVAGVRMTPQVLLDARRDLMRMEMPERWQDVIQDPIQFSSGGTQWSIQRPPLSELYLEEFNRAKSNAGQAAVETYGPAELLYMIVEFGSDEDRAQFNDLDIGDVDQDGLPEFLDGWRQPIMFLRWAPGFSEYSDIQKENPGDPNDPMYHDAFDTRGIDPGAIHMIPLIYSAGADKQYGIEVGLDYAFNGDPDRDPSIGGAADGTLYDNIHNHSKEQR
jgi:prepilin-type N-terminal cleavage/methylation domain-containing protein